MDISMLMDQSNIFFDLDLKSKQEVFEFLAKHFLTSGYISSKEAYIKAVEYRETLSETGLGEGIAIPHGKDASVVKAGIAFVRLKQPIIEWESMDDAPVQYVFLLAIPEKGEANEHIRMISELARKLIHHEVIQAIKQAANAQALLTVFKKESE